MTTTLEPPPQGAAAGHHPQKQLVSLAEMAAIVAAGGYHATRKFDGELSIIECAGAVIIAERMVGEISGHLYTASDRARLAKHGQWYAALTVAAVHGENVLQGTARERWGILCSYAPYFPPNVSLAETVTECAAVMAAGAEGICAVPWTAPWGNMLCHKAAQIHAVRVTGHCAGTQSVFIADAATGQPRGKITLRGGKCDQVKPGSIIRVEAMAVTDKGLFRQPQPCREWLMQY